MPENTVKVDRSTKWGNPFRVGSIVYVAGMSRQAILDSEHSVAMYRQHVNHPIANILFRETVRKELAGKNLACWCKPGEVCHADVLLEIANEKAGK